jgi:hypothetical protein
LVIMLMGIKLVLLNQLGFNLHPYN